jgi:thiamine-monophosphate kinase
MKAQRANLSDLVAKGAAPGAALLTLIWPRTRPAEDIALFAEALAGELEHFRMSLIGGDTSSTDGPLTVSITAFGVPLGERVPARSDAKPGEDLWLVGGEIGSAWLGLQVRSGRMPLSELRRGRDEAVAQEQARAMAGQTPDYLTLPGEEFDADAAWLMSTYLAPFVQVECAELVARFAGASMDVSDGLVADAAKLAEASGVKLVIEANAIPFAIPAQRWAMTGGDFRKLITGGDDYVVLFTAAPESRAALEAAEAGRPLRLTRVGRVEAGAGVEVVDLEGKPVPLDRVAGYAHKLGA